MIEFNTALVIILIEVSISLFSVVLIVLFVNNQKKGKDNHAASSFIDQLEDNTLTRSKELEALLRNHCDIDANDLRGILQNVKKSENALFRKVLELFLKKDASLLQNVNKQVTELENNFCSIIQANQNAAPSLSTQEKEDINNKLAQLEHENVVLAQQLQTAMQTMDEISSEYTKVFSGTQSERELENSRKKMIAIFLETEKSFASSSLQTEDIGDHL